jgi:hypothetical protein
MVTIVVRKTIARKNIFVQRAAYYISSIRHAFNKQKKSFFVLN